MKPLGLIIIILILVDGVIISLSESNLVNDRAASFRFCAAFRCLPRRDRQGEQVLFKWCDDSRLSRAQSKVKRMWHSFLYVSHPPFPTSFTVNTYLYLSCCSLYSPWNDSTMVPCKPCVNIQFQYLYLVKWEHRV